MRIVGGKHRSRVLKEFSGDAVRPTADKVRESLFNILQTQIEGASFLDLFAGTGAVGIEALSRGANNVVFTDSSKDSIKIIKENLALVKEDAEVYLTDAISYLNRTTDKFDIVFIDPPYKSEWGKMALNAIVKRDLLTENGIAIFESETPFNGEIDGLNFYDERKYGRVYLSFFKKKKPSAVFAGTFDPVTIGHYDMVIQATKEFSKVYVVLMINPNKTPYFTKEERLEFLRTSFSENDNIIVDSHDGYAVDYLKKVGTPYYIRGIRTESDYVYEKHNEELSLTLYPQLKTIYYQAKDSAKHFNSTAVRQAIADGEDYSQYLLKEVYEKVKVVVDNKKEKLTKK